MAAGVYGTSADLARAWHLERRFEPAMDADRRRELLAGWHAAVARVRSHT
jgi:glycerol kinase